MVGLGIGLWHRNALFLPQLDKALESLLSHDGLPTSAVQDSIAGAGHQESLIDLLGHFQGLRQLTFP